MRPTFTWMSRSLVVAVVGANLYAIAQRGSAPHRAQAVLHVHVVDLHHGPVDVEVHRPAAILPGGALGLNLLDRPHQGDVGVHPEARAAQPFEDGRLRGQLEALDVAHPVAPDRQGPRGRGRRVELPQAAGSGIARVGEGRQARLGAAGVELRERGQGQVDLAAHLDHRGRPLALRRAEHLRDGPDRAQVGGDVLADHPVPARGALHEAAVLVGERDREAVDLRLHPEAHLARSEPLLLHDRAGAPVPGGQLLGAAGVGQAEHRPPVPHRGEPLRRSGAHALGGRVGREQLGVLGLERLQLAHPPVVDRVVDRRGRRERSSRGWPGRSAPGARRPGGPGPVPQPRPRQTDTSSSGVATTRSGPSASRSGRAKKPQVTAIVTTPAARPAWMSNGASPT